MDRVDLKAIQFKAAKQLTGSVHNVTAEIIVMHSMECPPKVGRALQQATSLASGGEFFAHYYTDPETIIQVAELGRTVAHVGSGNSVRGIWTLGIEQAGNSADMLDPHTKKVTKTAMTRQEWIDAGTLNTAGPLVAALIAAGHGGPRWLSPDDLKKPGVRGITSHNSMRIAFGGTTHTDPGDAYPHDLLLEHLTSAPAKEPDMALAQHVDGHLEMFRVANGALVQNWQNGSRSAKWSGWQILDKSQAYVEVVGATTGPDGNVNVLVQTSKGYVAWWFDHVAGKWNGPVAAG